MTAIWQDIEIDYKGETHTIRPTIAFINHIESATGRSITAYVLKVSTQDIPVAWSAEIVAAALRFAGVNVTADDIYMEHGINPALVSMAANIILACLPPQKKTNLENSQEVKSESGKRKKPTGARPTA